jgi:lysophospholipase L1-like esterase
MMIRILLQFFCKQYLNIFGLFTKLGRSITGILQQFISNHFAVVQVSSFQRIRNKYIARTFLGGVVLMIISGILMISAFVQRAEKPDDYIIKETWISPIKRVSAIPSGVGYVIKKEKNTILHNDIHDLRLFYKSLDSLSQHLRHKVNIVHIGDSHIQADIFPGQIRQHLQTDSLLGNGGRGLVFPHSLTGSHNSFSLKVTHSGRWAGCKTVEWGKSCDWGIAGVVAVTYDVNATFSIDPNTKSGINYDVTKVKIFFPVDEQSSFLPKILNTDAQVIAQRIDNEGGYMEFSLRSALSNIIIGFERMNDTQKSFTLQGISLENETSGVQYHSLGINGVDTHGFLRSPLLEQHLSALKPDLVIISLGTNDAYVRRFDASNFKRNYGMLIQRIRRASPKVAILLTTPGDCMFNRYYPNYNTATAGKVIMELAEETGCAVWDLFNIMGGLRSINVWCASGLAQNDRLHYTAKGYSLQGDLLYDALMQDYVTYGTKFPMRKLEVVGKK